MSKLVQMMSHLIFKQYITNVGSFFILDPLFVEGIIKFNQYLIKLKNYSLAKEIYDDSINRFLMHNDIEHIDNAAILFVAYARFTYLILREENECIEIYKRALLSCSNSKYVFANYMLHLSLTVGDVESLLLELMMLIKDSRLSENEKKDLLLKLKSLLEERGGSITQIDHEIELLKSIKHSSDISRYNITLL